MVLSRKQKIRKQRGGVSPACVLDGAMNTSILVRNPAVNLHNTNPQASLDLDNKFMSYGGPVPLGSNILQGGFRSCGDEGSGGSMKSNTFKQYLDGLAKEYNSVGGGSNTTSGPGSASGNNTSGSGHGNNTSGSGHGNNTNSRGAPLQPAQTPAPTPAPAQELVPVPAQEPVPVPTPAPLQPVPTPAPTPAQGGGGFTTDPSEFIAGQPVYRAYDDCCPPALVNGDLKFGSPGQPICGLGAIKGGGHRQHKSHKKHSSKKHSSKKHSSKKHSKRNRRTQRGGADWVYSRNSVPAPYGEAFNGEPGVFRYPDDMTTRTFDETTPNYSANAI